MTELGILLYDAEPEDDLNWDSIDLTEVELDFDDERDFNELFGS